MLAGGLHDQGRRELLVLEVLLEKRGTGRAPIPIKFQRRRRSCINTKNIENRRFGLARKGSPSFPYTSNRTILFVNLVLSMRDF